MKKVLLYSNGMDSWLIDKIWKPDIKLYVDMKTRYSEEELKRLPPDVQVFEFPLGQWELDNAIIPLRNMYLFMVACNLTEFEDVEICLGSLKFDRSNDKQPEFIDKLQAVFDYVYQPQWWLPNGKKVKLNLEFKKYSKPDLVRLFVEQGGDINDVWNCSFSCYDPVDGHECLACKPCIRKATACLLNGYKMERDKLETVIGNIKKTILPAIQDGTYGRGEEEKEVLELMKMYEEGKLY